MTDFIHAYTAPEKYAVDIPIHEIVCDEKVDPNYVRYLDEKIDESSSMKPIVVVKHPRKDIYAVLDGHHRFWAMKSRGAKTIRAAVVDDYTGLGFELTRSGALQPPPEFTRYIRIPIKAFVKSIERFLNTP